MLANLLLIGFLGFMGYWWGVVQGWFSAWLHLIATVVAASLALGLWEVITLGVLMPHVAENAWAIGLVAPFLFWQVAFYKGTDLLITTEPELQPLVGKMGGAVCGLASGVLSSGVVVIGLNFTSLPVGAGGYRPAVVDPSGVVIPNPAGDLWLPVDRWSVRFMERLSDGVFANHDPLGVRLPALIQQAVLFRMRYDPYSRVAAVPGSVRVEQAYQASGPVEGLDDDVARLIGTGQPGQQLLLVETVWSHDPGSFDVDGVLRVPPTQVRLIVREDQEDQPATLVPPLGWTWQEQGSGQQFFGLFNTDLDSAYGLQQESRVGWVFKIGPRQRAEAVLIRRLRFAVPQPLIDSARFVEALGRPAADSGPASGEAGRIEPLPGDGTIPLGDGGQLELSDMLPFPISANQASTLTRKDNRVVSGQIQTKPQYSKVSRQHLLDRVYSLSYQAIIRVGLDSASVREMFGLAAVSVDTPQPIWLEDSDGQRWQPIGYVWAQGAGAQEISIDPARPIVSARQLPRGRMKADDQLYLYFAVPRGATLKHLHMDRQDFEGLDIEVPETP